MLGRVIFNKLENIGINKVGPKLRSFGQNLFKTGIAYGGDELRQDQLVKSLRWVALNDKVFPRLLESDWIAPNATIIGDVRVDVGSSIWHTVNIRGDTAKVTVGKNSIIQDRWLLKSTSKDNNSEINIGNNVFIGPNWSLDSCTVDDFGYVGMGATLHKGVVVEPYAIVAAGSVVPEGTTVPSGQVWAGNPAKYLRDATQEEKHQISEYLLEMQQLSLIYHEETEKSFREIFDSQIEKETWYGIGNLDRSVYQAWNENMPVESEDFEYLEHRVESFYTFDGARPEAVNPSTEEDQSDATWNPYHQDVSGANFPEIYKMYGENYERYEKVKARFENEKPDMKYGEAQDKTPDVRDTLRDKSPWEKKYDDYMPKYTGEQAN